MQEIKADMIAKNLDLKAIQEKQVAIELVGNKLVDSSGKELVVKSYFPENKMEERIVSGIACASSESPKHLRIRSPVTLPSASTR